MYKLKVEREIAAAHALRQYKGKCARLHGHNWKVILEVQGERLDEVGMLIDFGDLKHILTGILMPFDHQFMNEVPPFDSMNPTSENLARHVAMEARGLLPDGVRVAGVTVYENRRCSATFIPDGTPEAEPDED